MVFSKGVTACNHTFVFTTVYSVHILIIISFLEYILPNSETSLLENKSPEKMYLGARFP